MAGICADVTFLTFKAGESDENAIVVQDQSSLRGRMLVIDTSFTENA